MGIQKSIGVLFVAGVLCFLEWMIYQKTGMSKALGSTGLSMVTAYKFLWLMVLTGAAGVTAPLASFLTKITGRKNFGWACWGALVGLVMLGYTAFSFLGAQSVPSPGAGIPPVSPPPQTRVSAETLGEPQASKPASSTSSRKIQDTVVLADSKVEQVEPEKIRVGLQFKNISTRTVTQLDYVFSFTDETNRVIFSIPMREGIYIPPGLIGESSLDWTKSGFPDPAPFERMKDALSKKTLKAVVTVQRAELDDKSVAGS